MIIFVRVSCLVITFRTWLNWFSVIIFLLLGRLDCFCLIRLLWNIQPSNNFHCFQGFWKVVTIWELWWFILLQNLILFKNGLEFQCQYWCIKRVFNTLIKLHHKAVCCFIYWFTQKSILFWNNFQCSSICRIKKKGLIKYMYFFFSGSFCSLLFPIPLPVLIYCLLLL